MTTNKTTTNVQSEFKGVKFTDADIVNIDDWIPADDKYNPLGVTAFLLHDHGFTVAVIFASNLQDALDEAADAGKLDQFQIDVSDPGERDDYLIEDVVSSGYDPKCPEYIDAEGRKFWWREGMEPDFLGNASEPFDIEGLDVIELPNPPRSFCAQFNARNP